MQRARSWIQPGSRFAAIIPDERNVSGSATNDEAACDYLGIDPTGGRALDLIDQHGRLTAGDLARERRLSSGAVTALVDRLERAGCARRIADEHDRRRVLIEVTPVVKELSRQIYGAPEDAVATWAGFSDDELEILHRFQEVGRQRLEERLERVASLPPRQPLAAAAARRSARPRPAPS